MAAKRYYLDANVMLSYIDGDEDRLPEIDELFRRGDAGEVELVTSALSMVEVAFASAEKDAAQLDPQMIDMPIGPPVNPQPTLGNQL
jgi:predicted nucleic acid-binding protein